MKHTGQTLKNIREEKGISIEEVVLATKIKSSTLKAIEEGDLKQLPSKTFIRGFVQSYARYLRADEDAIMESFLSEMGSTIDIPKQSEEESLETNTAVQFVNSNRHPLFKAIVIVSTIILITAIYFISKTIDKYQQEKQLVESTQKEAETIAPLESLEEEQNVIAEEKEDPAPDTEENKASEQSLAKDAETKIESPKAVEEKKEAPAVVSETKKPEAITSTEVKTETTKKVETPVPTPKENTEAKPSPAPVVKKEEVKKPEAPKAIPEKKTAVASFIPQEIIIEALDNVTVEFKTDDSSWVKIDLKPEQIHTIKARNEIRVRINDGGAVNIIHNGKDKGVPGTLGAKTEIKFP